MSGKILIVDDEEAVRFFTADALRRAGWQTYEADSGEAALSMLEKTPLDVMLLDLRMPDVDGLAVMRQSTKRWPEVMIIIMTAYASIDSAIEAVRQGAFDYLQKPCSTEDIVACANRALTRKEANERHRKLAGQSGQPDLAIADAGVDSANKIRSGELEIDFGSHAVFLAGQPISLTPTEYGLLEILAEVPGQSISLKQLIEDGLGYDAHDPQAQETLRVHISRLRRKLAARYIVTVRGGGYALAKIPPLM
ncbi:MAG: response regulator transcription factor [Anaerolineae bacterium]|nr:response regulator transcription factor [Anaerolineae bacterium]